MTLPEVIDKDMEEMETVLESPGSESETEGNVRRVQVHNIIQRLGKRFKQQRRGEDDNDSDSSSSSEGPASRGEQTNRMRG